MADATHLQVDARGIATLTLDRAEVHNAFDERLIAELSENLARVESDDAVRVLVLRGAGKSFSAGADLNWMRRSAGFSPTENERDAMALARMLHALDNLTRPTVAAVHGAAMGGGAGLVACCDVAIASTAARFAFSEVRLGLIPATIGPYVVAATGARAARRYFMTGERFDAAEARRIGLVHEVVAPEELDAAVERSIKALLASGPQAILGARALVHFVQARRMDDVLLAETAGLIAERRTSDEGREGVAAFLDKRRPAWYRE